MLKTVSNLRLNEDVILPSLAFPKRTSDVIVLGCSERTNRERKIDDKPPDCGVIFVLLVLLSVFPLLWKAGIGYLPLNIA